MVSCWCQTPGAHSPLVASSLPAPPDWALNRPSFHCGHAGVAMSGFRLEHRPSESKCCEPAGSGGRQWAELASAPPLAQFA